MLLFNLFLKLLKVMTGFTRKKYQSGNQTKRLHTNNQQKSIDCLKPRSNKNERESKKCGCSYFYVSNYFMCPFMCPSFSLAIL